MIDSRVNVTDSNDSTVKIADVIPEEFISLFKYERLNAMQTILLPQILHSDVNMVIAAPTGSGKTVVHELAIVRLLLTRITKNIKCVFIAPNKALCQQRCVEWRKSFGVHGISVMEMTGDIDMSRSLQLVAKANIIVTTPEKWDSLTRSWRSHLFLLGAIDLLLLDEVHHLGEDRGPTLETVVVRMRILCDAYLTKLKEGEDQQDDRGVKFKAKAGIKRMRIIALSATLPNLADIGDWLQCAPESVHFFDEGYRPVPLTMHTLSYGSAKTPFLFERSLDDKVPDVVKNYSEGKQTLIFCSSKKGTESLAKLLLSKMGSLRKGFQCTDGERLIQDSVLRDLVSKGFGYHHGGLPADDRAAIEESYLSGSINVLCSTSTLAHGVNLPAHLVIIKGTYCWRGGAKGYEKLAKSDVIQMMGRAGRPGFDTHGTAVIMTSSEEKKNYEEMSLSADIVESHLPTILIEAICSEITQTVIENAEQAIKWLKSTYFYVRVRRNPAHYGFGSAQGPDHLDSMLMAMCTKALSDLSVAEVILYDPVTQTVEALPEAHIMTRHMIQFRTMVTMMKLHHDCDMSTLFKEISSCCELLKPLRRNEKALLNGFMKVLRFPLKIKVQNSATKGYVLMQAAVERLSISDFSLRIEQSEIVEVALRILSALQSLCIERSRGHLLEIAILVNRALRVRMWDVDYGSIFFQCQGLSEITRRGLNERSAHSVKDLERTSSSEIQDLLACSNYEANQILLFCRMYKRWTLDLYVGYGLITNTDGSIDYDKRVMKVDVVRTGASNNRGCIQQDRFRQQHSQDQTSNIAPPYFHLICYHAQTSVLLCHRRLTFDGDDSNDGEDLQSYSVTLPANIFLGDVKCLLLSSVVGLDTVLMPRCMPQIQAPPKLSVAGLKAPSVKSLAQSASKADNGGYIGGSIQIRKNLKREKPLTNLPDGDMRTWMIEKELIKNHVENGPGKCIPADKNEDKETKDIRRVNSANNMTLMNKSYKNINSQREKLSDDNTLAEINKREFKESSLNSLSKDLSTNAPSGNYRSDVDSISHYEFVPPDSTDMLTSVHNNRPGVRQASSQFESHGSQERDVNYYHGITPTKSATTISENDMGANMRREYFCDRFSPNESQHFSYCQHELTKSTPVQINIEEYDRIKVASNIGRNSSTELDDVDSEENNQRIHNLLGNSRNNLARGVDRSTSRSIRNGALDSQYGPQRIKVYESNTNHRTPQTNGSASSSCSSELAMLRRKNIELRLDSIPVKRLRTAASPGFKENEKLRIARYQTGNENSVHKELLHNEKDDFDGMCTSQYMRDMTYAAQPRIQLGSEGTTFSEVELSRGNLQKSVNKYEKMNTCRPIQSKQSDTGVDKQYLDTFFDTNAVEQNSNMNSCMQQGTFKQSQPKLINQLISGKESTPQMAVKQLRVIPRLDINRRSRFTHSADSKDHDEYHAHVLDMDSDYFSDDGKRQPIYPLLQSLPAATNAAYADNESEESLTLVHAYPVLSAIDSSINKSKMNLPSCESQSHESEGLSPTCIVDTVHDKWKISPRRKSPMLSSSLVTPIVQRLLCIKDPEKKNAQPNPDPHQIKTLTSSLSCDIDDDYFEAGFF